MENGNESNQISPLLAASIDRDARPVPEYEWYGSAPRAAFLGRLGPQDSRTAGYKSPHSSRKDRPRGAKWSHAQVMYEGGVERAARHAAKRWVEPTARMGHRRPMLWAKRTGMHAAFRSPLLLPMPWLGVLALILGTPGCGGTDPYSPDPALFESGRCWSSLPDFDSKRVDCGFLRAPLVHGEDRGVVRIAAVRLKAADAFRHNPPVVFLQGGPGVRVLEDAGAFIGPLLANFGQERDLLFFDPRGVGLSEPTLHCPTRTPTTASATRAWADECRRHLEAKGVELSAFTSLDSAQDVALLGKAFGYEKLLLYGTSYGSLLAQHIMRDHPSSVHAAILDGVVPLNPPVYVEDTRAMEHSLQAVLRLCRGDPACNNTYPDLASTLDRVLVKLRAEPLRLPSMTATGAAIDLDAQGFLSILGLGARLDGGGALVPKLIESTDWVQETSDEARTQELRLFVRVLQNLFPTVALGRFLSTVCAEYPLPDEVLPATLWPETSKLAEEALNFIKTACDVWNLTPLPESARSAFASPIPVLLLSSEVDPATPPFWARTAPDAWPQSHAFEFPFLGHVVGFSADPCPRRIIQDFVRAPHQVPDGGCIGDIDFERAERLAGL